MVCLTDQQALDAIATLLGTSEHWRADSLEEIGTIVSRTERPHPGNDARTYAQEFRIRLGRSVPPEYDSTPEEV
jgi:hypothetical protein